ncbi:MAG: LytR/AlgR family response regulator transcription factor [Bacteroidia bacterium]
MMKITAIALDDEPAALEVIRIHARMIPFLDLKASFLSAEEALGYLMMHPVDLVFLDIEMPDMHGTQLAASLQQLGKNFVFTTAHPQYAIEGFNLQALDFLLKPISFDRFFQACNRAYRSLALEKGDASGFFVKDGYDWVKVEMDEVSHLQSDGNLLHIYQRNGIRISTRMTLQDMLNTLPGDLFLRVHKSYAVAIEAVKKIERHQLTLEGGLVPLASSYREQVLGRLISGQS